VHLQTFLSIPITKRGQILRCDTLVANERYVIQSAQESTTMIRRAYRILVVIFKVQLENLEKDGGMLLKWIL